jgi:uncharacterized membrane protein
MKASKGGFRMSHSQQQGIPAYGFLVVAFLDEMAADEALDDLKEAKIQHQFYFEGAAVVQQNAEGKVDYHETGTMSTGKGAGIGALVGGVLGILGGPAGVALGASAGAAVGAAIAYSDKGLKTENLEMVGVSLKPGTSAIVVVSSHDWVEAAQKQIPTEDIRAAVVELGAHLSARLGENKNVALGFFLAGARLGLKEIAASEEASEVVDAVIAG